MKPFTVITLRLYRAAELEVEMKRRIGPKAAAMTVDQYLSLITLRRLEGFGVYLAALSSLHEARHAPLPNIKKQNFL